MIKVMKTAAYTEQLFLHVYPLRLAFNFISKSHNKKKIRHCLALDVWSSHMSTKQKGTCFLTD